MEFKEVISINGMPGLYTTVANKSNGIIVKSLVDGKSTFAAIRIQGITPLDQISIYLQGEETIALWKVMNKMLEIESTNPIPTAGESDKALSDYFRIVIPEYDEKRVHISAMKKMVKWFELLKKNETLPVAEPETTEETESE